MPNKKVKPAATEGTRAKSGPDRRGRKGKLNAAQTMEILKLPIAELRKRIIAELEES
jgi:hypothetical protein